MSRAHLLDEVERAQLAKALEQLHDLVVVEVRRESADKDLVDRVGHVGRHDAGDVRRDLVGVGAEVVLGAADLERAVGKDDAVKRERVGRLLRVAKLRVRRARAWV